MGNELALVLSPEKTAITHINDGFMFLGYRFMTKKTEMAQPRVKIVIPHEAAQSKLQDIKKVCQQLDIPETEIIRKLNNMLRGWMIYYRCVNAPRMPTPRTIASSEGME